MISERTLRKWRLDALRETHSAKVIGRFTKEDTINHRIELYDRILRLTQELMDLHLFGRSS